MPDQQGPNSDAPDHMFSAPIPGQSLTKAPGSTPWQKPPKYTKLSDACDAMFDRLCNPPTLRQLLSMMKAKVPLEHISRILIFSGFSTGYWTPDLGLLMVKPVMYMLAGIAARAGLDPKLTNVDRSGFQKMVGFKKMQMTSTGGVNPEDFIKNPPSTPTPKRGIMSPIGA